VLVPEEEEKEEEPLPIAVVRFLFTGCINLYLVLSMNRRCQSME